METSNKMQLQKSNGNTPAIPTAQSLAEIRMAESLYPRYRNIPGSARQNWLASQVSYLASIMRIRDFEAREPVLMAVALDEMIMQDRFMADLTLPEIADAFKNGVFGIYGEVYGLSAPNLYGFISSFLDSEKKKDATTLVRNSREQSYAEKKEAEKEARERKIREEMEEAKRRGEFIPTGKVWFKPKLVKDAIDSSGHREKVRQQAREILKKE